MASTLCLQNVNVSFGERKILKDCNLGISAGSSVAVLGDSGAGKSTLLRVIAGLTQPEFGEVIIDGSVVNDVLTHKRGLAMMSQQATLFPHLNVLDNVAFGIKLKGVGRKESRFRACKFLEMVGMLDHASRRPQGLSGGETQRVTLARALAVEPSVLLLDEPFSSLDNAKRSEMRELVRKLCSLLETTLVFVTHDQEEALVMGATIALLQHGSIVQHGSPYEIYYRPHSLEVARFFGCKNEIHGDVVGNRFNSLLGSLEIEPCAFQGSAIMLIRQEAISLTDPFSLTCDTYGTIQSFAHNGPLSSIDVLTPAGVITIESGTILQPETGDLVGLVLPISRRVVLPLIRGESSAPAQVLRRENIEVGRLSNTE